MPKMNTNNHTFDITATSVFSCKRELNTSIINLPKDLQFNQHIKMVGLYFLNKWH